MRFSLLFADFSCPLLASSRICPESLIYMPACLELLLGGQERLHWAHQRLRSVANHHTGAVWGPEMSAVVVQRLDGYLTD